MSVISSVVKLTTSAGKTVATGGLSLLANLKNYIIAGLVVLTLSAGTLAVYRGHEMDVLDATVAAEKQTIAADKQFEAAQTSAMSELEKRSASRLKHQQTFTTIRQEATNATQDQDGAVAPVLRDTLARLGSLRADHGGKVRDGSGS